jgi:hypothetical protein
MPFARQRKTVARAKLTVRGGNVLRAKMLSKHALKTEWLANMKKSLEVQ